jgi:hypothetical protein
MTALECQLDCLASERRSYTERLKTLIGQKDREPEVAAYLSMIEQINDATIRLVRQALPQPGTSTFC